MTMTMAMAVGAAGEGCSHVPTVRSLLLYICAREKKRRGAREGGGEEEGGMGGVERMETRIYFGYNVLTGLEGTGGG